MALLGLSQAELGRRAGLSQPGIYALLNRNKTGSRNLHRIARELQTTPAYLTGETDDPDEGAPPPPPRQPYQLVTIQAALPSEETLAQAFAGVLMASEDMDRDELAHELARRLPLILSIGRLPQAPPHGDRSAGAGPGRPLHEDAPRARRRA